MSIFPGDHAVATNSEAVSAHSSPLDRAKAISGLISERALEPDAEIQAAEG